MSKKQELINLTIKYMNQTKYGLFTFEDGERYGFLITGNHIWMTPQRHIMNFKPNHEELNRLMHQVRRLDKKPYQLMREAFTEYMNKLEAQEAKELTQNDTTERIQKD